MLASPSSGMHATSRMSKTEATEEMTTMQVIRASQAVDRLSVQLIRGHEAMKGQQDGQRQSGEHD